MAKNELNFLLAITTYNRLDYLKTLLNSFFETRSQAINWQIIVADDGSTDGTLTYLESLQQQYPLTIIRNQRVDIHRQVNTILRKLSSMDFDFCFKCDDDVLLKKSGWDLSYWETAQQTGYQHLIFYDKSWRPHVNLDLPIRHENLASNCPPENIQGAFYTLTPEIIQTVGFFDEIHMGRRGVGHVDYSFRCCRLGFNRLTTPFDLANSNDFIRLQGSDNYVPSVSSKNKALLNSKETVVFKRKIIQLPRTYIPYNENYFSLEKPTENLKKSPKINPVKYPKADATFYPERGIGGFFGFLLKRFYNLAIDLRLYFIPKGIKSLGRILNKISIDLMNIEQ